MPTDTHTSTKRILACAHDNCMTILSHLKKERLQTGTISWKQYCLAATSRIVRIIMIKCVVNSHSMSKNQTLIFATRCYAYARLMSSCDVCVCVSVTFMNSVETSNRIVGFFSPSDRPIILVFLYQTGCQYSDGDPHNGGVECKGVWKNHDFLPISRFISELMQDTAIVTVEGE